MDIVNRLYVEEKKLKLYKNIGQWLTTGQWFSRGTLVSSTNKTDCHNITEILLKVVLNNKNTIFILCVTQLQVSWNSRKWKQITMLPQTKVNLKDEIKFNTEIIINGLLVGASYLFITPKFPLELKVLSFNTENVLFYFRSNFLHRFLLKFTVSIIKQSYGFLDKDEREPKGANYWIPKMIKKKLYQVRL